VIGDTFTITDGGYGRACDASLALRRGLDGAPARGVLVE